MRGAFVGCGLFLIGGCTPRVSVGCDRDTPYDVAVARWSAYDIVYDPLAERAKFTATLESHIFREQRVQERARELGWPPEVQAAELAKETQAADAETSFVVGAYTDRSRDNDLGDSGSMWRIALETPAGELVPSRIELLGRPSENLRKLYPYLNLFEKAYRVHFAHVAQGPVTLRIASGEGIADLVFERL